MNLEILFKGREGLANPMIGIVEDDGAIRDSLSLLLTTRGFEVRSFASAVEFLGSPSIDRMAGLVIDQQMPDISGVELVEILRARNVPTPVIMMTGGSDPLLEKRALKAGALALIKKPLSTSELVGWLKLALIRQGDADRANIH